LAQTDPTKADYVKNRDVINDFVLTQVGGLKFSLNENGILTISIEEE
jgi:hypothetical protein